MYASFLKKPLFKEEAVLKEVNAIDAEFNMMASISEISEMIIIYSNSNPQNPLSRYHAGNQKTLLVDSKAQNLSLSDELHAYFNNLYSADAMKLVVQSSIDNVVMQEVVKKYFSDIPKRGFGNNYDKSQLPFRKEECQRIFYIESKEEKSQLQIFWPLESLYQNYKQQNNLYLDYWLTYSDFNSIISILQRQNLAYNMQAEIALDVSNQFVITLKIQLTDKGLQKWQKIVDLIFYYIYEVVGKFSDDYLEKVYQQLSKIEELNFDYEQPIGSLDEVSQIASQMQDYKVQDAISGPYLISEFDIDNLRSFIKMLKVENSFIALVSNRVQNFAFLDKVESQYGTKYAISNYPEGNLFSEASYSLKQLLTPPPDKNPYIPEILDLVYNPNEAQNEQNQKEELLKGTYWYEIWYSLARELITPKVSITISLQSSLIYTNAQNYAMSQLYSFILTQVFNEKFALQIKAGRSLSVSVSEQEIMINIYGFNHKTPSFLDQLLRMLITLEIEQEIFTLEKSNLWFTYNSLICSDNIQHGYEFLSKLIQVPYYTSFQDIYNEIDKINYQSFTYFINKILMPTFFYKILFIGNYLKEDALQLASILDEIADQKPNIDSFIINREITQDLIFRAEDICQQSQNNLLLVFYVFKEIDQVKYQCLQLIDQLFYPEIYNNLRTNEQLGYAVDCIPYSQNDNIGELIYLQSHKYSPAYLSARLQNQIYLFYNNQIKNISQDYLDKISISLEAVNQNSEVMNLKSKSDSIWQQINQDKETFSKDMNSTKNFLKSYLKRKREISQKFKQLLQLKNKENYQLTVSQLQECFDDFFVKSPRIEIQLFSDDFKIPEEAYPDSVGNFKSLKSNIKRTKVAVENFNIFDD